MSFVSTIIAALRGDETRRAVDHAFATGDRPSGVELSAKLAAEKVERELRIAGEIDFEKRGGRPLKIGIPLPCAIRDAYEGTPTFRAFENSLPRALRPAGQLCARLGLRAALDLHPGTHASLTGFYEYRYRPTTLCLTIEPASSATGRILEVRLAQPHGLES